MPALPFAHRHQQGRISAAPSHHLRSIPQTGCGDWPGVPSIIHRSRQQLLSINRSSWEDSRTHAWRSRPEKQAGEIGVLVQQHRQVSVLSAMEMGPDRASGMGPWRGPFIQHRGGKGQQPTRGRP
jgi:hypothetical protein